MVTKRALGPFEVMPVGLGYTSLSSGYGAPPSEAGAETLLPRSLISRRISPRSASG